MMIIRKRCAFCNHPDREDMEGDLEGLVMTADQLDKKMDWMSGTASKHQRNHMGHYEDSSNPRCNICTSEMRGDIEMNIYNGDMTPEMAAKMENCSVEQVVRHMRNHVQPLVQKSAAQMIAARELDEVETLTRNIRRLEGKIDELFDMEEVGNPKYIDSLTKMAKEIRESLKYVMEFKGKLVHKRQDTIIVHQMQIVKEVLAQNHPDVWLDVRKKMEEKMT